MKLKRKKNLYSEQIYLQISQSGALANFMTDFNLFEAYRK